MGNLTIKLSRKYDAHSRTFDALQLREPTGADLDEIGDISEIQYSQDNVPFMIYHDDRVQAYRKRLLVKGDDLPDDADLAQLSLVDALAVRDAVAGFFSKARAILYPPRKISSSLDVDGS